MELAAVGVTVECSAGAKSESREDASNRFGALGCRDRNHMRNVMLPFASLMQMRMLAVAFGPPTMAEAVAGLPRIREAADCVELRLDLFDEPFELDVGAVAAPKTRR